MENMCSELVVFCCTLLYMLVRMAVRYLNSSLPNPIPCMLDILEVLVEDTEQPRFLPWEFDTIGKAIYNTIHVTKAFEIFKR